MSKQPSNSPLRVTFVAGSVSRRSGGVFGAMKGCAIALNRNGVATSVLGLDDSFTAKDLPEWAPLVPLTVAPRGPPQLGYAPGVLEAINDTQPDIVHQHGIWQAFSRDIGLWRRRTGRTTIISPHGMLDPWALRNARWKKVIAGFLFEWDNLDNARCLHALNEAEAQAIRTFGLRAPVAVIPNGVDLPDASAQWEVRPRINGRKTLIFIGRIHPKKGLAGLLRAFALLRNIAPAVAKEWQLVIAGWDDGGHLSDLKTIVLEEDLGEVVRLAGPLYGQAKEEALRNADAFVLPSFSEGLPMAVLEAAAYRLPILMTEACNLPEFFVEGAAYRISTDPESLAYEIAEVLDSGDHATRALTAEAIVQRRFDWARIAAEFRAVYHWLERGGEVPSCIRQS